jgi:hypothetical protein
MFTLILTHSLVFVAGAVLFRRFSQESVVVNFADAIIELCAWLYALAALGFAQLLKTRTDPTINCPKVPMPAAIPPANTYPAVDVPANDIPSVPARP